MDQEDYACDKFTAQKVKKDFCRHCFQPKRLHELKVKKSKAGNEKTPTHQRSVAAGIKITNETNESASTRRTEHKQEENLKGRVAPPTPETQLPTANVQSQPSQQECAHVSDVKPGAAGPANSNVTEDEPVTVDSNTGTTEVEHGNKEMEQLSEDNKRSEEIASESHQIPLDNNDSNIKGTDISSYDVVASLDEGNTGNNKETGETHNEGGDSEVAEDTASLVEESNISEEVANNSCPEEAGGEDTPAASPTLLAEDKTEQVAINTTTHVEGDDHVNTSLSDITSTLPSSSVQNNTVPSWQPQQLDGEEAHKNLTDDRELVSAEAELPQSYSDVTSLVANDPAQPTFSAADSQAPPMIVNDQGFNIPVPPSPPPIRAPPPPPPPPDEEPPSPVPPSGDESVPSEMLSPQDPERGRLLSDIRSGAQLKHVPWPQEKKAGEVEATNVESELRNIIQRRRRKEVTDMAERLEANKDQIERLIKDIMEATKHAQRVSFLKMLQDQITQFLQASQLSLEVLDKRCLTWPTHQVSALSEILDFMDKLEVRVQNVEALCRNSTINPDAVQRCVFEVVRFAKECNASNTTTRFSLASSAVQVSQTDIDGLILRASRALIPLLDKLYEKAFVSYRAATDGSTNKFDLKFRLTNAQRLLKMCCSISDSIAMNLDIQRHAQYSEAQLKTNELQIEFNKLSQANEESAVTVLKATEIPRNPDSLPRKTKEEYATLQKFVKCIPTASLNELDAMLCEVNAEMYRINELQLIRAAISSKKVETVKCLACAKEKFDWEDDLKHAHDYDWLCEAVTMGFSACLEVLVQQCGVCVNAQSIERAQTALHIAARKPDFPAVLQLLQLGADPLLVNSEHRTPLQLIAIKHFPFASTTATTEVKEFLFDLSEYLNNPSLSDVTLVSKDGKKFPAHRLVLCAQSGYFKALLGSDLWQEGMKNEVSLGTVDGAILQILLEYLYTGKCLFPRDDLNKALELLATAEMFLLKPMSGQCETVLSEKLSTDVVVPIYQTAFFHVPKGKLYCNCCHYILMNYKDIEDPDHQILKEILENKIKCI